MCVADACAAELEARLKRKVSDLYVECYGKLPTLDRSYLLLHGDFKTADGEAAEIPVIKYYFKHAPALIRKISV